ncbi:MAG: hypothetical protein C0501_00235 [Isosphaera sp.]|nr:hypothetical protein [Isosphaera sp.]
MPRPVGRDPGGPPAVRVRVRGRARRPAPAGPRPRRSPPPPVPAFGGAAVGTRHQAGLAVVHPAGRPDLVIPDIIVQALPLLSFGIEAVVGRDVLAGCVLVYDGPAGSATLAY